MKYFCVCESCGSNEWVELYTEPSGRVNTLNEEGDVMIPNVFPMGARKRKRSEIICSECEGQVDPIPFKDVTKSLRIKIYFMESEDKISWIKSYQITDSLNKELTNEQEW